MGESSKGQGGDGEVMVRGLVEGLSMLQRRKRGMQQRGGDPGRCHDLRRSAHGCGKGSDGAGWLEEGSIELPWGCSIEFDHGGYETCSSVESTGCEQGGGREARTAEPTTEKMERRCSEGVAQWREGDGAQPVGEEKNRRR